MKAAPSTDFVCPPVVLFVNNTEYGEELDDFIKLRTSPLLRHFT